MFPSKKNLESIGYFKSERITMNEVTKEVPGLVTVGPDGKPVQPPTTPVTQEGVDKPDSAPVA